MPMSSEEINSICTERLGRWQKRLVEEHATPVLLLGVGHDHKSGQLVICTLEEMTDAEVIIFLRGALNKMVERFRTGKLQVVDGKGGVKI